jgi:hypothetical protein
MSRVPTSKRFLVQRVVPAAEHGGGVPASNSAVSQKNQTAVRVQLMTWSLTLSHLTQMKKRTWMCDFCFYVVMLECESTAAVN